MTNTDYKEGKIEEVGGIEKEEETRMSRILEDSVLFTGRNSVLCRKGM